jgi:hypothetical protein
MSDEADSPVVSASADSTRAIWLGRAATIVAVLLVLASLLTLILTAFGIVHIHGASGDG